MHKNSHVHIHKYRACTLPHITQKSLLDKSGMHSARIKQYGILQTSGASLLTLIRLFLVLIIRWN